MDQEGEDLGLVDQELEDLDLEAAMAVEPLVLGPHTV